ncbi:hypothetical protein SDC9_181524 [bioreactor metagenome]|uniref:Uncharacterized protein n=1 Tax=bioreactor metagenome TaxID=1076179 RepID=A0A645H6Q9_9ZZZZ
MPQGDAGKGNADILSDFIDAEAWYSGQRSVFHVNFGR